MNVNPEQASWLLKAGILFVRADYLTQGIDKSLRAIEDELGYSIGKEGHTIRKWKSGEIPFANGFRADFLHSAEVLAKQMVAKGKRHPDQPWATQFLKSVGHPTAESVLMTPCGEDRPYSATTTKPAIVDGAMGQSAPMADGASVNPSNPEIRIEIVLRLDQTDETIRQQLLNLLAEITHLADTAKRPESQSHQANRIGDFATG